MSENTKIEWQPIDTAPKDGTRILVFRDGEQYVAQWLRSWEYWGGAL